MKPLLILLLAISPCVSSCTHNTGGYKVTGDYMIIGPGGGFRPPIATFYLLTGDQLRADTSVIYYDPPADISQFHFDSALPASKHLAVKDVLTNIPSELLGLNHADIGTSNVAADGGYTLVRAKVGGTLYEWKFHDDLTWSSGSIRHFVSDLNVVFIK